MVTLPFLLMTVVVLYQVVAEVDWNTHIHVLVQVVGIYQYHQDLQLAL
jgi:hypothetical protein